MQYGVVKGRGVSAAEATSKVEISVNEMCEKGWTPLGGISVVATHFTQKVAFEKSVTGFYAVQAMVKEDS